MKKRILALLLCVSMLATFAVTLSSCKKKYTGEPTVSKKVVDIDLTDYKVVFSDSLSSVAKDKARAIPNVVKELSGASVRIGKASDETEKEILIGQVDREAVTKALKGFKGDGFTIRVIDDKIVIVGTTNLFTYVALQYFYEHYMTESAVKGTTMKVNQKVLLQNVPVITLAADNACQYEFVYGAEIDDDPKNFTQKTTSAVAGQNVDYPYDAFKNCTKAFSGLAKAGTLKSKKDDAEATANEILIGQVNRDECKEVLASMTPNQYGVFVKNGKVLVTGWTDKALAKSVELFQSMIKDATKEDKSVVLPPDYADLYTLSATDANWLVEFPRPEAEHLELIRVTDVGDDSLVYAYRGSDVTKATFDAYCKKLEGEGYTKITENVIETNCTAMYTNVKTNAFLYVQLALYPYAQQQNLAAVYQPILRITAAPLDTQVVPGDDLLTPTNYDRYQRLTDTMLTAVKFDYDGAYVGDEKKYDFGMSYVITLEDGTFFLFDGGTHDSPNVKQSEVLWNILCDLKVQITGKMPSADNPIHVRGWVLTHGHVDHYGTMHKFIKTYGQDPAFKLDYMLTNFPSDEECYQGYNPTTYMRDQLPALQAAVRGGFKYLKLHTGEHLYFQNLEVEVLFTHEEFNPQRTDFYNDTSTILRLTFNTSDAYTGYVVNRTTGIFTGDAYLIGSRTLRAMYGETLQSDMVQSAHHGGLGMEAEFYSLVNARVVLIPGHTPSVGAKCLLQDADLTSWYSGFVNKANRATFTAPNMRYIIYSDICNYTMKFGANGVDCDHLYTVGSGALEPVESPDGASVVTRAQLEAAYPWAYS